MAGGGHIIIRPKVRAAASLETVSSQLGPLKQAKLADILAKSDADWSHSDTRFVWKCVLDAYEAYE